MTLQLLGQKHGTDKAGHGYLDFYEHFLLPLKDKEINLCELGVFYGSSIKMWYEYFPNGTIFGLDSFQGKQGNGSSFPGYTDFARYLAENEEMKKRVSLHQVDQSKVKDLTAFVQFCQHRGIQFDVIIDDASHLMYDQQITLYHFYPLVKPGGFYIIEDIHTSSQDGYDVLPDKSNTTTAMLDKLKDQKIFSTVYLPQEDWSDRVKSVHYFKPNPYSQTAVIEKI